MKHSNTALSLAASLLTLLLTGCGGTPDPSTLVAEGVLALNSGDPGEAVALLDRALEELAPGHPDHAKAQVALAQALAPFEPDQARDRFLGFAEKDSAVTARLYRTVSDSMFSAGAQEQALDVMHAGIERFPEATELADARDELSARLAQGATPEQIDRLRSLGYIGGQD